MSKKYHDALVSLQVTVSVESESKEDAQKKLAQLSNEEIIKLVTEQMPFIDERFSQSALH
jgi:hypothetical protein